MLRAGRLSCGYFGELVDDGMSVEIVLDWVQVIGVV